MGQHQQIKDVIALACSVGNLETPAPAMLLPAIPEIPCGVAPSALNTRPCAYHVPSDLFLP